MSKEKPTTKKCKYCRTEIPYDAKICPNCRKKQRGNGVLLIVGILMVIALIGSCFNNGSSDSEKKNQRITETTDAGTTYQEKDKQENRETEKQTEDTTEDDTNNSMEDTEETTIASEELRENQESSEEQSSLEAENVQADAVDPELKAFLDEYEAVMNEYVDFMKKYTKADNPIGMLADYTKILKQYTSFAQAIENYDSKEMSAADAAYYLEVTSRVSKKLLEVAY